MEREDRVNITPSIETRSHTRSTIPFRGSNQKIHNPQSLSVGEWFIVQSLFSLIIRRSKPNSMKPFLDPTSTPPQGKYLDL
jgi:hypothetical protein